MIHNHALALPDNEAPVDELAGLRLRGTSPGVYRLDHGPGRHDDRAFALGLAALTLLDRVPVASSREAVSFGYKPRNYIPRVAESSDVGVSAAPPPYNHRL